MGRLMADSSAKEDVAQFLPDELREIESLQTALPRIAKDSKLMALIEATLRGIPTRHDLHLHDARELFMLEPRSVHLILTSPPYWTLKDYHHSEGQLGAIADYEEFLAELDKVWEHCFRWLAPGAN